MFSSLLRNTCPGASTFVLLVSLAPRRWNIPHRLHTSIHLQQARALPLRLPLTLQAQQNHDETEPLKGLTSNSLATHPPPPSQKRPPSLRFNCRKLRLLLMPQQAFFFEITKFYQWGTLKELMILGEEEGGWAGVSFSLGTLLPSLIIISGPPSPPYRSIHKSFTEGEKYNMGIQIKIYVYIKMLSSG